MPATGPFSEDTQGARGPREGMPEVAIGRETRALRQQQGLTVADLARKADLSGGMLSRIENGQAQPSLTTVQSLAQALHVPLTAFFIGYEETRPAIHVKAGDRVETERTGTRAGHRYNFPGGGVAVSACFACRILSDRFPGPTRASGSPLPGPSGRLHRRPLAAACSSGARSRRALAGVSDRAAASLTRSAMRTSRTRAPRPLDRIGKTAPAGLTFS